MARTRASDTRDTKSSRNSGARRNPPAKVAITVRLDAARARQLQTAAEAENRTLTNYVETTLVRDLLLRDEAARVITMCAAPGTATLIDPADIVRADDEDDAAYARRQALLMELWSIPDSDQGRWFRAPSRVNFPTREKPREPGLLHIGYVLGSTAVEAMVA